MPSVWPEFINCGVLIVTKNKRLGEEHIETERENIWGGF